MTGRVTGKVALITGAARGQGRSHAVQLAREGADIIAVDYLTSFDTVSYPMATQEDQRQTVKEVEALGRRILTIQADVRDEAAMRQAVADGVAEFGKIDVVVANAGICAMAKDQPLQAWVDVSGVTSAACSTPSTRRFRTRRRRAGAVVTGSLAALVKGGPSSEPGGVAYSWAKRSLVSLVHDLARRAGASLHSPQRGAPVQLQHGHAAPRGHVPDVPAGSGAPRRARTRPRRSR